MLKPIDIDLKQLSEEGKAFKWDRPKECSLCNNYLWGHGFQARYFDGFEHPLFLKRWRCSHCKACFLMMPSQYLKYFKATLNKMVTTLKYRLKSNKWPPDCSRQKAAHWLRKLKQFCLGYFGVNKEGLDYGQRFVFLVENKINFLSR